MYTFINLPILRYTTNKIPILFRNKTNAYTSNELTDLISRSDPDMVINYYKYIMFYESCTEK